MERTDVFKVVRLLFPVLSVVARLSFLKLFLNSQTRISSFTLDAVREATRWLRCVPWQSLSVYTDWQLGWVHRF